MAADDYFSFIVAMGTLLLLTSEGVWFSFSPPDTLVCTYRQCVTLDKNICQITMYNIHESHPNLGWKHERYITVSLEMYNVIVICELG